jgi:hypothetical protein
LKINELPDDVKGYWLNTAVATPPPFGPLITDYYGYNWSGNLEYFYVSSSSEDKFFNPVTATYFTCDDTAWGLASDCWDRTTEASNALVGRPDSDNYRYSNSKTDFGNTYGTPANDLDMRPGVLNLVAESEGYKPYMYSYRDFNVTFADDGWYTGDYTMAIGTMGALSTTYNMAYSSLYNIYPRRESDSNHRNAGFRCVVPLD